MPFIFIVWLCSIDWPNSVIWICVESFIWFVLINLVDSINWEDSISIEDSKLFEVSIVWIDSIVLGDSTICVFSEIAVEWSKNEDSIIGDIESWTFKDSEIWVNSDFIISSIELDVLTYSFISEFFDRFNFLTVLLQFISLFVNKWFTIE